MGNNQEWNTTKNVHTLVSCSSFSDQLQLHVPGLRITIPDYDEEDFEAKRESRILLIPDSLCISSRMAP